MREEGGGTGDKGSGRCRFQSARPCLRCSLEVTEKACEAGCEAFRREDERGGVNLHVCA